MLDVIGAGFGRTGTASLKAALDHLGFGPCYHMFEVLARPERMSSWSDALDGREIDWEDVFAGYRSTVDWPGTAFWRELTEAYPEAKVILTVRDPEKWYESTYNTLYQIAKQMNGDLSAMPAEERAFAERTFPTINKMIWKGTFDERFADREYAIEVFERHNAEVRRAVPAEQLLVYQLGQGWEPLCDFLGVDVPAEEFPHVNDTASLPQLVDQVRSQGRVPSPFDGQPSGHADAPR